MYLIDLQYFPNIYYISTLYRCKSIVFIGNEQFKKSTFRNRMDIPSSTGVLSLSIPIKGGRSVKLPYEEVEIDYKTAWQQNHLRSINTIYGNAPYFQFYLPILQALYNTKVDKLFNWNLKCLDTFLKLSKMSNLIQYSVYLHSDDKTSNNFESSEIGPDLHMEYHKYEQVFIDKIGFKPNMSCIDILMNLGPDTLKYIQDLTNKLP